MAGNVRTAAIKYLACMLIAAVAVVFAVLAAGCSEGGGAEAAAAADLEAMRLVDLGDETEAELRTLLDDESYEYYEMFLGKAGEFEYTITGTDETQDGTAVHVRITTYDFASEYLRSWTEFFEEAGRITAAEERSAQTADDTNGNQAEAADDTYGKQADAAAEQYDTAELYRKLFYNLGSIQNKEYIADVDITCTQDENGNWTTDAAENTALKNAIVGGLLSQIVELAK